MNEEIFNEIWQSGTIVLDTCVLDFIERSEVDSAKKIMDILLLSKDKVFIPNHVKNVEMKSYFDLKKNKKLMQEKIDILIEELLKFKELPKLENRNKTRSKTQKFINQISKYDFQILSKKLNLILKSNHEEIIPYLKSQECINLIIEYDDFLTSNTVKEFYSMIMTNTWSPFTKEELDVLKEEGKERRYKNIPPGCGDDGKLENSLGDFIIWKEILRNTLKKKYKKTLFITEDKKGGSNWFDRDHKNLHPKLKEEVKSVCNYEAIYISDLRDFIINCKCHVGEDIEDLINYVKNNDNRIMDMIKDYFEGDGYEFLTELTWDAVNEHCDIDHSLPDSPDMNIVEFSHKIVKDTVEADVTFILDFDTDNIIRFGGKDIVDTSSVYAKLKTKISLPINQGYYREDIYNLDFENMEFDVIDMYVDAEAPFGMGSDDCEPDDCEPDDYEPDDYEPDDYEPDDYEPDDYEPDDYEPDDYEPDDY